MNINVTVKSYDEQRDVYTCSAFDMSANENDEEQNEFVYMRDFEIDAFALMLLAQQSGDYLDFILLSFDVEVK